MGRLITVALLAVPLAGCRAPDSVQIEPGYNWYNVDSSGWRGQSVSLAVGWSFGGARAAQLAMVKLAELQAQSNERQVAMMMHQDVSDPVVVNVDAGDVEVEAPVIDVEASTGVQDKAIEALTDTSPGAFGIPNMVWFGAVFVAVILTLWKTGLLPKRKPRAKN